MVKKEAVVKKMQQAQQVLVGKSEYGLKLFNALFLWHSWHLETF